MKFSDKTKPNGEPWVWFSSMGLVLGLTMVVFLLGLIIVKGLEVFWPAKAVHVTLKEDSSFKLAGTQDIFGITKKTQEKIVRNLDAEDATPDRELQFFVGNKDVFGFSFYYVDEEDVLSTEYPKDLMRVERLEYGDAFGFPLAVKLGTSGKEYSFDDPKFGETLHHKVEEANKRWEEIRVIERKHIGKINHKLSKLKEKREWLEAENPEKHADKIVSLQAKEEVLLGEYEVLAAEARQLRSLQRQDFLTLKVSNGKTHQILIGDIVEYYYPNQLNAFQRVTRFFHRMGLFLVEEPREANTEGGVFPAIFGTFVMTVLMSLAVTPFGVVAAIYLREYAKQGVMVKAVRIAVNNLAGVPSIVFGVFGLGFFVYFVGGTIDSVFFKESLPTPTFGTGGILWASLTLALLTVPVVIVATEEALASVPRGMREGSLACGASKWQTIQRIILPAAAPGILTGLILAMARGAGEVAPLMLVGVVKLAPNLPLDGIFPFFHLERKFMHLGFHIYDLGFQSPDSEAAKPMVFATTLLLITLVMVFNMGAIVIRNRLKKKFATGAF